MTIKTAEEYRADAAMWHEKRIESIDRCDTDGFVSQAAHSRLQSTALWNAGIVEQGYVSEVVITNLEGKVIATSADQRDGEYGFYYLVQDDEDAAKHGRFLRESKAQREETRIANNAKKGIVVKWVRCTELSLNRYGTIVADTAALRAGRFTEEPAE